MLAIRTHLYILGEIKACSNSSDAFFSEEVQKLIHNIVLLRKLRVFLSFIIEDNMLYWLYKCLLK